MKIKLIKLSLSVILCLITQTSFGAIDKLVLVGGIYESRVGQCGKNTCDNHTYLKQQDELGTSLSILNNIITNSNIKEFGWSGDPVSHNEGGNLKNKFENWFYNNVCTRNEPCNVSFIAHSWGSIIASDFIASLPDNTNVNVRIIVTYGAPVTGAQIEWSANPFWEVAALKVRNMGGTWINAVNSNDIIAWDIPKVINRKPNGSESTKGRLSELFPVNNSELDPKYLATSLFRQCNKVTSCSILIDNLDRIWSSSGVGFDIPITEDEWIDFFSKTHFTKNYEPKRIVNYIKSAVVSGVIFDYLESSYSQLFSSGSDTVIYRKDGIDARYRYYPNTGFFLYFWIDGNLYYSNDRGASFKNIGSIDSWYNSVK